MENDGDIRGAGTRHSLPISKLRHVPQRVRVLLKTRRITSCGQLLQAAGDAQRRQTLARMTTIDPDQLLYLVRRADMSRVNGVGQVFGTMLEILGVMDVPALAQQDPEKLHDKLRILNQQERLARRSPTLEEVVDWIEQASKLKPIVTYEGDGNPSTSYIE